MDKTAARTITLCPCSSSQIAAYGYCHDTQTLAVQFKNKKGPGAVYHYAAVPPAAFEAFDKAESKGKHLGEHIKCQDEHGEPKFAYTRLPDVQGPDGSAR